MVATAYKPLLEKYLSRTRTYTYKHIRLQIPPQVFHPGFFYSTQMLLKYISHISLQQRKVLELGAGSGLIAIYAAQKGAYVTATDINTIAIEYMESNMQYNKVELSIIHSDLFHMLPQQTFDMIIINPPYYKKNPVTEADYAWYCGEQGEYFQQLFKNLNDYIHTASDIVMTLCDACDLNMITTFAAQYDFQMECIYTQRNLLEKNFIYKIQYTP